MRIMITGGAGFQGSHLAEKWVQAGHHLNILNTYSREAGQNIARVGENATLVWGSVTDSEIVEKTARGCDVIVHMAAHINVNESILAPADVVNVNVSGSLNVLEAARKLGSRVIYASSCEVYGFHEGELSEESELRPRNPYAASKAAADRLCFAYRETYRLDVTILRPSNVYGERQKSGAGGAVIPIFVTQALAGKPLAVSGEGLQSREYLHVSDLTQAYDLVLNRDDLSGATLNVGTGETPSVIEIAEFIASKFGSSIEHVAPRPGEVAGFRLDCSRIRGLGFRPQVTFWEGLARYIEWRQDPSVPPFGGE